MLKLSPRWHHSILEISEENWRSLLGNKTIPFYRWEWFAALEKSNSISPNTGWQPFHLALWRGETAIAVAPLFLKGHSYGEFVFDQAFIRLAGDLGLTYFPKLLGMSPLSPVRGYRFFISPLEDESEITSLMLEIIDKFAVKNGILSCNFLYVDSNWLPIAEKSGCAKWVNQNSLWFADDKKNFSDYLSSFNANQRRNIKRERRAVLDAGIEVSVITE